MSGGRTVKQHSGNALKLSLCNDMKCAMSRAYDLGWIDATQGLPSNRRAVDLLWYVKADVSSPSFRGRALRSAYVAGHGNQMR